MVFEQVWILILYFFWCHFICLRFLGVRVTLIIRFILFWHIEGHYLSATARMWASTHNETVKEKMSALVTALYECQDEIGNGYLSAFPTWFFDRFEDQKSVWAPYYTIHKVNILITFNCLLLQTEPFSVWNLTMVILEFDR